jgi:hypothetical protein
LGWAERAEAAPKSGLAAPEEFPGAAAAASRPAVGDPDWATLARYDDGWARREAGRSGIGRREAAERLDAALEPGHQATAQLRRELEASQTGLQGFGIRADRLDAALTALEATRFAPTTRLMVSTYFTPGATRFGGTQDAPYPAGPDAAAIPERSRNAYPAANNANWGAAVVNYEVHLNLLTSFTGKDLLYTRLNTGNGNNNAFSGNPYNLLTLDKSTAPRAGANVLDVTRLFYRFPIGRQVTALVGPVARPTHEITALRPWFYGAEPGPPILDFFSLNGAPGTYNKATGAAVGAQWKQAVPEGRPYLAASASYVAPSSAAANTTDGDLGAGIGGRFSRGSIFGQVGIGGPGYVVAAAWRYGQCGLTFRRGTQFANQRQPCASAGSDETAFSNNVALTAAWQPTSVRWLPSINLGWGASFLTQASALPMSFNSASNIAASQSWSVALFWRNLVGSGHAAGFAVGQPTFVTRLRDGRTPQDGNVAWEAWTALRLSDHITLTPSLFYLSRPNGQFTAPGKTSNALGTVLVAHFRF